MPPAIAVASTLMVSSISISLDWMLTRSSRLRLALRRRSRSASADPAVGDADIEFLP